MLAALKENGGIHSTNIPSLQRGWFSLTFTSK